MSEITAMSTLSISGEPNNVAELENYRKYIPKDDTTISYGALDQNLPGSGPEKYYLSTAIAYTNGYPHIGHAYEFLTADVLTRYHRVLGYDTFFLTGSDEHGQKVANSAEAAGRTPIQHCDIFVNAFKALQAERLGIELKKQIKTVESKISKADTDISAYGVSPDMVRKALTLDTEEVENAPDLEQHMIRLSEIISVIPEMRVKRWQWRVLEPAEAACTKDLTSASSATAVAESVDQIYPNQTSVRKVELQMTVAFAEGIGPRLLVKQTEEISNKFRKWSGALVIRDPALSLRKTDVSIPSLIRPNVVNETGWCVSVPAKIMVQP